MPPKDLVQALTNVPPSRHPDLIVGPETLDDAGVFRLSEELALVQTVDFFPPIVDDARWYGRIAAANSLSDVYAMGGRPLTVLNIVGFPHKEVDLALLAEILQGGYEKASEAGAVVCGGHSVADEEIKYGMAVTGVIDPKKVVTNSHAAPGDSIVLTKRLGMGAMTTALREQKISSTLAEQISAQMATLNRAASEAMVEVGVHACTDVTGFGLVGHASNVARASHVTVVLETGRVPFFEGARELAREGYVSGAAGRSRAWLQDAVEVDASVPDDVKLLCFDAETSGGLLQFVEASRLEALLEALRRRRTEGFVIGHVEAGGGPLVRLVP
ncbi:MAG: selenide, water dikinase SelD [Planctomycetota bacterium]